MKINLIEENWDNLIILDACRYDFFKKTYKKFLHGTLRKIWSVASETSSFLKNTFKGYYEDIVYVSANPYVNSKNTPVGGFNANEHFFRIIDVWNKGIDKELGVVPPEEMNEFVIKAIRQFPTKRFILHYMQPHTPFLIYGNIQELSNFILRVPNPKTKLDKIRNKIDNRLKHVLDEVNIGRGSLWRLKEFFKLPPASTEEIIIRMMGKKGLRRAYEENLELVLEAIREVIPKLNGKTVVTSDHGEHLGENNKYRHTAHSNSPLLRVVPYFESSM